MLTVRLGIRPFLNEPTNNILLTKLFTTLKISLGIPT